LGRGKGWFGEKEKSGKDSKPDQPTAPAGGPLITPRALIDPSLGIADINQRLVIQKPRAWGVTGLSLNALDQLPIRRVKGNLQTARLLRSWINNKTNANLVRRREFSLGKTALVGRIE